MTVEDEVKRYQTILEYKSGKLKELIDEVRASEIMEQEA
jgi:hypothetical protein